MKFKNKRFFFSSESVTEGHPDKMCDKISDAILDAILSKDPNGRVACETATTTGLILVCGEITTDCYVDMRNIVRDTVKEIGYTDASYGFDAQTCGVIISVGEQSPDISQGVSSGEGLYKEQGAGDQGMMFGFACNETDAYMPAPIYYAHKLTAKLTQVRKTGLMTELRPDGKSQVTIEYENGRPKRIDAVVISTQHSPESRHERLKEQIIKNVIKPVLPEEMMDGNTKIYVNPTGKFVVGGPHGDAGLTGRKIIVDTYGGYSRHGGGAFSGKDPSKVDRSAAYMTRYIAKNVVAAGLAEYCEIQLAYAIGVAEPLSVFVETFGTAKLPEEKISELIRENFELKPAGIIESLELKRPIYKQTAAYGHFGREDVDLPWERLDKVDALKKALEG